jgi:hypothetical protein
MTSVKVQPALRGTDENYETFNKNTGVWGEFEPVTKQNREGVSRFSVCLPYFALCVS